MVSPTFVTLYIFSCAISCILQSNLQENTTKVLHEGGHNSIKAGFQKEWSWKQNSKVFLTALTLLKARIAEHNNALMGLLSKFVRLCYTKVEAIHIQNVFLLKHCTR